MTHVFRASIKQIDFINSLLSSRDIVEVEAAMIKDHLYGMTSAQASQIINRLLSLPKIAQKRQNILEKIPTGKYAIPADEINLLLDETTINGDLLFVEIRTYQKTTYMRKLVGSIGAFTRIRMSHVEVERLAQIIEKDPYKYTKLFGEHYTCCGRCGAPLTDPESRRLFLGPECRKHYSVI